MVVHSAGIRDRDGAALVIDRIRQRFNWLEPVWTDGGYNAHQMGSNIARNPGLHIEVVNATTT